ncbi:MAG: hypothetical protein V4577_04675 [Bacteroidota bacterium]
MDTIITAHSTKRRLFKEFEYPDLIPYSIAVLSVFAFAYLLLCLPHTYL